ncbi:MAG: hypothetical protein E7039_05135 [Lentisphaerae bacterium]|nr:hypothetical protein [Lentisphaerota bacterium]
MATITTENGVTIVTGATAADTGWGAFTPGSSYFCANGLEVTVSERTDSQSGYTVSWTHEGVAYSQDLTADVVLIGGGWNTEVASASIIMNGGTVNDVYGGGVTADADVTGDISVVVNGGNIVHLNGAGGCGSVGGNVNMVVGGEEGGPNISTNIIGGGWFEGADVAGDVTITLKNGQLGTVPGADGYPCTLMSGGGVFADVAGKVTINIEDGNWYAIVAGGAMISGNVGSTEINMNGGTVTQINGAAADYYTDGDIGSVGSAEINVAGGTVLDAVVGGSVCRGEVTDSVEINVTGGVINTLGGPEGIIGGSQWVDITGTTSVNVTTTGENAPVINGSIAKADDFAFNGEAVKMNTIYAGEWATDLTAGIIGGINVFADVSEAMKVVENNGIIKIAGTANLTGESGVIAPWGEGTDAGVVALYELDGKTVTWTADSEAVIDVAVRHIVLHGEGTLNISKNVVLDYQQAPAGGAGESLFVIGSFWAGDDATEKVTVNLDGKIVVGDVALSGDNGSVKVRHNGVLNVSKTASIDADYSIRVRGGVLNVVGTGKDAEEAQLKSQRLEINGAGIEGGAASVVNIKDSYVSITYGGGDIADSFDMQNNRDYGYAKEFNFENSRVETGTLKLGDSVTVFKGKDSDFTINKNVTNAATINLEGSTFDVAGTVTNSGSINVAGKKTSKLDFTFADASTNKLVNVHGGGLEDSSFNGNMLVTGDAAVVGENTVDGIAKVVNGATLTVADEATLTVNKIALGEDNYGTLDVGEADEYAQKGGKLEVEGTLWGTGENGWGLNINVDANASMEIKDGAYVQASQIAVEDGGIEMTLADKAGYLKIADGSTLDVKYLKAFGRGEIDIEGDVYLNNDSHNETNFSLQVGHATLGNGTVNINSTGSVTGNGYNAKVFNGSELNIKGGSLNLYQHTDGRSGILQNDGIIDVSGASTINVAKVQGDGWIYMNGASVGADTNLVGANVRFASGSNVVDGSTITNGRFQVGIGTYQAPDSKVDTVNGVTVTVKNNAHIDTIDGSASPFGAWVGSEYYDKQADKDAAMTDAKYTLNIQNSIAEFGYLHISHDGFLNVTGDADELHNINATDYSFRSGQLNVNGVATFDNVTAMAFNANISCDNATKTPGKLVVTNGATFYAKHEDNGLTTSFEIWNNGIVEISNKATFFMGEHDAVLNIKTADAKLIVNDATLKAGDITNNGTITVEGGANVTAGTILNAGTITVDGRSSITANEITTEGTITIDGAGFAGGTKTIIDLAAGIDLTGKVNLENGDGLTMIIDKDSGDVYLTDATEATVWVNDAYEGLAYGTAISGKEKTYAGINAFGHIADAIREAAANDKIGTITVEEGTAAELYTFAVNEQIVSNNANGLIVNMGKHGVGFDIHGGTTLNGETTDEDVVSSVIGGAVTIGKNVKVYADQLAVDPNKTADIQGLLDINGAYLFGGSATVAGTLTVSENFILQGGYGSVPVLDVKAGGVFSAANLYAFDGGTINIDGSATVDNIEAEDTVTVGATGKLDIAESMNVSKFINKSEHLFDGYTAVIGEMTNEGSAEISSGKLTVTDLSNTGGFKVTGKSTLEIDTLTGNAIEVTGGGLKDSTVGGNILVTGDAAFDGDNAFGNVKVTNGAELIINGTLTGAGTYIGVGDDAVEGYYGIANGETAGGSVIINGNVDVVQVNANGGGYVEVAEKATLTTQIICVENGSLADAEIAAGDKLTVAAKGVVNTSDLYVQGGGELDVVGQVNVIGHYNNISGIYVNYGVTNVSGTMSVTNDASCGESQIGNVKFDNSKIKLNILDGGVFNLNTSDGKTDAAAKLNIVAGAELNINEGGTFNSDKVSVVVNNGTVNVDGTANINGSMTNDGAVVVDGTANVKTLTNNGTVTVNGVYNGNNQFTNGGSLTVDGGEFNVRDLVNGSVNPGTIELKNEAELNVFGTLSNSYNGTITIEAGSLITVDKFVNNGIIDISVKGDGVWLVIDGKEGMSNFGKVTVNGVVQDGLMYTDKDNGDLYLVNTRSDALYFNSEWDASLAASLGANTFKDTVIGDTAVEIKDGVNAIKFYNGSYSDYTVSKDKDVAIATLEDAIKLNLTAEGALTVETGTRFELDADSTLTITENGSVTIEAGDKDKAIAAAELNAGNIVNAGSVTVNGVMSGNVDNSGSVTVNGSATGNMTNSGTLILNSEESIFADFSNSGTVEIGENGKFTATDDFVSEGKFVVNVAEDMAGAKLVIDLAEGGAYSWNADDIEFNVADGMNAFYDADGDVAVSNASMATYEFNKAWAESELADLVDGEAGKSGFYYDINAFDDTAALTGQQKDAAGKLLAEKLAFYAGEYADLPLEQDMILESKADGVAQMNLTSTNVVSVNTKFNMAGSLALNGETAALNVAEKATATFDKIVLDDAATAVSNINGNLNVANDMQVRNMNIAATAAVVAKSVSVLENTGVNVKGSLSVEDMQIADNATVNVSGVHGKLTIDKTSETKAKATIAADATLNITDSAVFTCTGVVDNNGCINVSNASVTGKGKINNTGSGVITISGVSSFDTTITGSGAIRLLNNATIAGTLTIGGEVDANGKKIDTMLFVERNGYLAANANFTGKLNGMYMYIGGSGNTIKLDDESTITLMVADKTVFGEDDDLASVVIKGNGKNVVLTAADSALNGNKLENLKLNITAADGWVAADIALENILSINGKELVNDNGIFYYEDDNGIRQFVTRVEDEGKYGINITSGAATIYEVGNITIKEGSDKLANVNVVMKEGKTSFTVKNGKKDVRMNFAVGSILKSDLGGSNKVAFGNYNDVEVNGAIESINSLSIGNNSFVDIDGNITGQNTNDTVKIGADSEVEIGGYVDLEGGKNKFSVGARSEVTVAGSISGIADLNVASGKKAKKDGSGADWTDVTINGNYVAAEMNNKLTIGNYVNFTLGSVNGVSIDNGGVASATGTTVKVGTESVVKIAGSANGIAGVTTGKQSYVVFGTETVDNAGKVTAFAGADIEGSDKNNKLSTGAESTFKARDIDLCGGKNSIVTGKMSDFVAGNIDNVQTVTVGSQSSFKVGAIDNVNKFTVNKGKAASKKAGAVLTDVVVNGNVTMTTGKDSFTVGNDSNVLVSGNISFGDGKDTLSLGKNSKLAVNDITGMEVFKASAGATLIVWNGKGNDVNFDSVTGSWNKATIIDYEGDIELNDTGYGYVYANEKDCYDLKIADGVKLTDFSDDMEVTYAVLEDGVWSEFKTYTEGMELAAGTYRFEVGVAGEYEKLEKKTYSFTVAELA